MTYCIMCETGDNTGDPCPFCQGEPMTDEESLIIITAVTPYYMTWGNGNGTWTVSREFAAPKEPYPEITPPTMDDKQG